MSESTSRKGESPLVAKGDGGRWVGKMHGGPREGVGKMHGGARDGGVRLGEEMQSSGGVPPRQHPHGRLVAGKRMRGRCAPHRPGKRYAQRGWGGHVGGDRLQTESTLAGWPGNAAVAGADAPPVWHQRGRRVHARGCRPPPHGCARLPRRGVGSGGEAAGNTRKRGCQAGRFPPSPTQLRRDGTGGGSGERAIGKTRCTPSQGRYARERHRAARPQGCFVRPKPIGGPANTVPL